MCLPVEYSLSIQGNTCESIIAHLKEIGSNYEL